MTRLKGFLAVLVAGGCVHYGYYAIATTFALLAIAFYMYDVGTRIITAIETKK